MSLRAHVLVVVAACMLLSWPSRVEGQDPPDRVSLAAQGATADTVSVAASAYRVAFTLTNRGADSATFYIACTGLGAAACISGWADPIRLAPGQQVTIGVDYRATRAGRGLVVLRVRDPRSGARANAAFLLTLVGS